MNIPLDAISHDYCYSEQRLYEQHEINDKYTEDSGLKQGFVEELDTYIRRVYGGIDGYLSSGGFTAAEIRHLRNCLAAWVDDIQGTRDVYAWIFVMRTAGVHYKRHR